MSKGTPKGAKRAAYRANVEKRLTALGYRKSNYLWQDRPSQLLVIIGDEFRPFGLGAGKSQKATEYEMGRLSVWAEIQRLTATVRYEGPTTRKAKKPASEAQIDLEDYLDEGRLANGRA